MRHDKTKTSLCVKLIPLPRDDPRYDGLAPSVVIMGCNTCDYLATIKNDNHCIGQANLTARNAHKPTQTSLVPQQEANMQTTGLVNQLANQRFVTTNDALPTDDASIRSSLDNRLSSGLAPMSIDHSQTTTTSGRATKSSINDQGVVRRQITRHMANGTVEHEVSEEHKNSITQTQVEEYQQAITHLQSQLKLVDSKWTEAKEECHDLQRYNTALSDVMGTAVCEAVMKKHPGTELTVALLVIHRLLLALDELNKAGGLEAFCKALPSASLGDPYVKQALKERGGDNAFKELMDMTDDDYKKRLPNLSKVGATAALLRKLGILPSEEEEAQPKKLTIRERGPEYFPCPDFITDYPVGELPSLLKASQPWKLKDVLTHWIHLHLTRADGERPELVKILRHGWPVQHMLEKYNYAIVTCFVAYECMWKHPRGDTYKCHVAEDLVKAHYTAKVREYNTFYGI